MKVAPCNIASSSVLLLFTLLCFSCSKDSQVLVTFQGLQQIDDNTRPLPQALQQLVANKLAAKFACNRTLAVISKIRDFNFVSLCRGVPCLLDVGCMSCDQGQAQ